MIFNKSKKKLKFQKKVSYLLMLAYQVLGNQEKRNIYDKLNKDLIKKDKVVANLKKLTDK